MLKGSCLCGGIRYEIDAELGPITNCHCGQCRKASGAAFASNASVPVAKFRFISGAELLKEWESSPGRRRCFCGRCGSPILKRNADQPETVRLRLGTLDTDPRIKPSRHIYIGSKAPWVDITDSLPQVN
jgi:hypothetical protein